MYDVGVACWCCEEGSGTVDDGRESESERRSKVRVRLGWRRC